jgi:hypothetical protein
MEKQMDQMKIMGEIFQISADNAPKISKIETTLIV